MTTLQEAIEDSRLWALLVKRYPELGHRPMPSIDSMVVDFLRHHDVFAKPVSSNINASPAMNAIMGAVGGPMAVGANQALTAQSKGAALQEWTSWKQWTLSHPDWPEFRAEIEAKYQEGIDRAADIVNTVEAQNIINEYKKKALKARIRIGFSLLFGIPVAAIILAYLGSSKLEPSNVESRPDIDTQAVSEAAEQCRQKVIASGAGADHQYFAGVKADTDKSAYLVFQRPDGTGWEAAYYC